MVLRRTISPTVDILLISDGLSGGGALTRYVSQPTHPHNTLDGDAEPAEEKTEPDQFVPLLSRAQKPNGLTVVVANVIA